MSSPPDALSLLTAALSASDVSTEAAHLTMLYRVFQSQPGNLQPLFPSLVTLLSRAGESLKKWIVDVIDLAFCRPTLGPQGKASLAVLMPEPLLALLNEGDLRYAKVAIAAFASIYQPLFRLVCMDRSQGKLWQAIESVKKRIVQLFEVEGHMGVKLAAIKAYQKIILVQTRPGDARSGSGSKMSNEFHVGHIAPDHTFLRVAPLEAEATERLTQVVTVIFTSSSPDMVMASMNSLATLAKFRQSLSPIVFEALISWTPAALASVSYTLVRSVEKTLRLLYLHFHPSRNSWAGAYASQIIEAVESQNMRVESAAREEEQKREKEATAKRQKIGEEISGASTSTSQKRKRVRFAAEDEEQAAPSQQASTSSVAPTSKGQVAGSLPANIVEGQRSASAFRNSSNVAEEENPMAAFDVTTLALDLVIELILANLQALTEEDLQNAISRTRVNLEQSEGKASSGASVPPIASLPTPAAVLRPPPPLPLHPGPPPSFPRQVPKEETGGHMNDEDMDVAPQDPLNLDVGDEEVLDEAEKSLEQLEAIEGLESTSDNLKSFSLKPPGELEADECKALMCASVNRICERGAIMEGGIRQRTHNGAADDVVVQSQLWSMLVTRLATRGFTRNVCEDDKALEENGALTWKTQSDLIRQMMLDFVIADFPDRIEFAVQWMAEEFYCEVEREKTGIESPSFYDEWLQRLVSKLGVTLDGKDRSLMVFLNRLPRIPHSIFDTLEMLCVDKAKMRIGFGMLRELAIQRIPSRGNICSILLKLTRNKEKTVRSAAIITVRNWVRANGSGTSEAGSELEDMVLDAARGGLRRLTVREPVAEEGEPREQVKEEADGLASTAKQEASEEDVSAQLPSVLDDPSKEVAEQSDVIRLVELPFALCVRVASMLDEIFDAFPKMPPVVQEAVKQIIHPLIQTLGPNNSKLLSLIRQHPPGSESLAVAVFSVMTEKQKSKKVVELVKEMAEEKSDIDPRFLIPILPDLVKAEIIKYLPRVVTILSSEKAEDRATIKAVFTSIVTMPAQGFGSISSNLPRVRSSELLSPVELMSLLHHAEREIGLKTTAEAIRICFGMTDIFNRDVLGAVLNLLLEEPVLPVLFMRTAIMAVRTYKKLSSYISTIFLSRLITKKVWQQPLLWDGFVLCAKQTAPASFGALIQLPKEQLRDVISRQPDLKIGLREYLIKKAGGHVVRLRNFLDLLGESVEEATAAAEAAAAAAAAAAAEATASNSNGGTGQASDDVA
ncbi:hypothetical protein CBS101457_001551 [Exobasidium rhododendri]|nr:hypothetical protein CBS101457_001551 [Exobasidium rhododendri]